MTTGTDSAAGRPRRGYLAYFNGRRGAERNPESYRRRDDGSHIYHQAEEYYEWWYFDASFDNGYHLVATFHYRNMFLKPMIPSVQMCIYRPDGTRVEGAEPIPAKEGRSNPDYCQVVMGDHGVYDRGDRYELRIRLKDLEADLTFRNTVPSWKPGSGFNYLDEEAGLTAGWVVPIPHGTVEGSITLGGETLIVKGHGYHDHNWGNFHCARTFSAWYWGRIHHEKVAMDYGWVLPREEGDPITSPLLVARPGEIVLSTDQLELDLDEPRREERFGLEYAGRLRLRTDALGVSLDLTIQTRRLLESMKLPKVLDREQYYFRFLADYEMTLAIDGAVERICGEMLHEYIRL